MRTCSLLFVLIIASCSQPERDNSAVKNQLHLNNQRNAQIVYSIQKIVRETGNREHGVNFLSKLSSLMTIKKNLKLDFANASKDSFNTQSSLNSFLDTLGSRYRDLEFYEGNRNSFETASNFLEKYFETGNKESPFLDLMLQTSYLETLLLEKYASQVSITDLIFFADYRIFKSPILHANKSNNIILTVFPTQIYSNSHVDYKDFRLFSRTNQVVSSSLKNVNGALLIILETEYADTLTLSGIVTLTDTLSLFSKEILVNEELLIEDN